MEYTKIILKVEEGIATLTLNSPENLNALNLPMYTEITDALKVVDEDETIKALIINSSGRAFCGGGDIGEMVDNLEKTGDLGFDNLAVMAANISKKIKLMSKPVIAAVNGACAGAAANISIACDFTIASEDVKFIQAFKGIGLIPDAGGVYLLTRAVGVAKATELAMLGRPVKAEEALQLGLAYKVVPKEELMNEAYALAGTLAKGPGKAFAALKQLIYEAQYKDFDEYMPKEVSTQVELGKTEDFSEGIAAFLEKRPAVFKGK